MGEILAFNDETITKAFIKPEVPKKVTNVFNFLESNQNLVTTAGGMEHFVTGLDRYKLNELAKGYNINFFSWMFAVNMFESGIIKRHNEKD